VLKLERRFYRRSADGPGPALLGSRYASRTMPPKHALSIRIFWPSGKMPTRYPNPQRSQGRVREVAIFRSSGFEGE